MPDTTDYQKLVRRAKLGDQASMDQLAHLAEPRLLAYLYRLTLRHDLAQDLLQETLLEMVESLKRLKRIDRFWPWLFRTALGKAQLHFRDETTHPTQSLSAVDNDKLLAATSGAHDDALSILMGRELAEGILRAMNSLRIEHRNVLNLRCFEQMTFREIARTMSCSELNARVMFFRAKQALKRRLARSGFGKGLLLVALGFFGRMTAGSEAAAAAIEVTAATAAVGAPAAALATVGSKVGGAVVAVGAATVIATAGVTTMIEETSYEITPAEYHATTPPLVYAGAEVTSIYAILPHQEQMWYYLPQGSTGPVFTKRTKSAPGRGELFTLLSNRSANYSYSPGCSEIDIENYRPWRQDLRTTRLPSDSRGLREFLDRVEPPRRDLSYNYNHQTGLLRSVFDDTVDFGTIYMYNTLDATHFAAAFASEAPVADHRDAMHRRGWTYFYLNGNIGGAKITGRGQLPFVYDAYLKRPPWMRISLPGGAEIVDTPAGSYHISTAGEVTAHPAGTFFRGLSRPWMGLHTLDTVRRDAAMHRLRFHTSAGPDTAQVTVLGPGPEPKLSLVYHLRMTDDLVESIDFITTAAESDETLGALEFTYLQDVTGLDYDFIEPRYLGDSETTEPIPSLWLLGLTTP